MSADNRDRQYLHPRTSRNVCLISISGRLIMCAAIDKGTFIYTLLLTIGCSFEGPCRYTPGMAHCLSPGLEYLLKKVPMCHQFWQVKTLNSIMLHIIPVSHGFLILCGENLRWHIRAASKELDGWHPRLLGKRACSWSRIDCHGILYKYHEADNSTTTQLICDIDNTPSYLVV